MARKKGFKIPGVSFSMKRALGISQAKAKLSRKLGVPLSKSGRQRKLGAATGCAVMLVPLFLALFLGLFVVTNAFANIQEKTSSPSTSNNFVYYPQNEASKNNDDLKAILESIKENTKRNWLDILTPALTAGITAFVATYSAILTIKSERKKIIANEQLRWLNQLREHFSNYFAIYQMSFTKIVEIKVHGKRSKTLRDIEVDVNNLEKQKYKSDKLNEINQNSLTAFKELETFEKNRISLSKHIISMLIGDNDENQKKLVSQIILLEELITEYSNTSEAIDPFVHYDKAKQLINEAENIATESIWGIGRNVWNNVQNDKV